MINGALAVLQGADDQKCHMHQWVFIFCAMWAPVFYFTQQMHLTEIIAVHPI